MHSLAERDFLLAQVSSRAAEGVPTRRACAEMGISFPTFYRWQRQVEAAKTGLLPDLSQKPKRGRKVLFDLTEAETRRLRFWRLVKGSTPLAVEAAIAEALSGDENPYFVALREALACDVLDEAAARARRSVEGNAKLDEAKARALRAYWQKFVEARKPVTWPQSIQRACRVSEDEEAAFRGPKAMQNRAGAERRGAFIVNEEGQRLPWFAGAIWCSDDMSLNDPFRFYDAAGGRELVGRQALFTTDAYSLHFLGASHIGRDRDSYRAEDIAKHFAALVDEHGLPLVWRIERGRWDNNFIFGTPIPGEFDDEGQPIRFGGLDAVVKLAVKFNSRGKEIEGCFNLLQSLMDHGFNGQTLSIGRHRGEFEAATRAMLRTDRDAADLAKFWTIEQSADAVLQAMRLFDTRPKQRQTFGNKTFTPAELWASHVKRPCPQNERWRFLPVKVPATISKGVVEIKVRHYPLSFRFRVHGASRMAGAHFVDGHQVMVAFDPSEAWAGCLLFNRDRSARNRDGWGFLERLGMADHMADAPQEDLSGADYAPGQTRAAAQVRQEFRALIAGTEFDGRRRSHAQDSFGNAFAQANAPRAVVHAEPVIERGVASEGRLTKPEAEAEVLGSRFSVPGSEPCSLRSPLSAFRQPAPFVEEFDEAEERAAMLV